MNANPAGITPMTVTGDPLRVIVCPRMPRSPPNRRCHMPWLRMITASFPGTSSSARNVRPSAGVTCSRSNMSHDTRPPPMRSAPVVPTSVAPVEFSAPMRSNTVFCCRQSRNVAGATEKRPNFCRISCTLTSESGLG